ncbi:MAG: hypothetical protein RIS64_4385, partial [Bacteroidota bacterium]
KGFGTGSRKGIRKLRGADIKTIKKSQHNPNNKYPY